MVLVAPAAIVAGVLVVLSMAPGVGPFAAVEDRVAAAKGLLRVVDDPHARGEDVRLRSPRPDLPDMKSRPTWRLRDPRELGAKTRRAWWQRPGCAAASWPGVIGRGAWMLRDAAVGAFC